MATQADTRRAAALSGSFALLAAAFRYPTAELATVYADGSYAKEALTTLRDAGLGMGEVAAALAAVSGYRSKDAQELHAQLRAGFEALFGGAGRAVVTPYEAIFRFGGSDATGVKSPVTLDVERQMRAQGVLPFDVATSAPDSFWGECSFLSYLFAARANALEADDEEAAQAALGAAETFARSHFNQWAPAFMEAVRAAYAPAGEDYAKLSYMGSAIVGLMAYAGVDEVEPPKPVRVRFKDSAPAEAAPAPAEVSAEQSAKPKKAAAKKKPAKAVEPEPANAPTPEPTPEPEPDVQPGEQASLF